MKNFKFILVLLALLPLGSSVATESLVVDNTTLNLINKLQSGGYIMYMRHGKTNRKQANRNTQQLDFDNCATQRNLSDEGISQTKLIGQIIKELNIPIGEVSSSPYCRTKDTANYVFGEYVIDPNLAFSMGKLAEESKKLGMYLLDAMLASTDVTANTVYVGHSANLKDGLGVWPKPEGVVVVFKKVGNEIKYIGMIRPEQWLAYSSENKTER